MRYKAPVLQQPHRFVSSAAACQSIPALLASHPEPFEGTGTTFIHVCFSFILRLLVGVVGVVGVVVVPVALVDAGVARRHRARLHAAGAPTFEFLGPAPSAGAERSRRAHSAGAERRRRRRAPAQSASAERRAPMPSAAAS